MSGEDEGLHLILQINGTELTYPRDRLGAVDKNGNVSEHIKDDNVAVICLSGVGGLSEDIGGGMLNGKIPQFAEKIYSKLFVVEHGKLYLSETDPEKIYKLGINAKTKQKKKVDGKVKIVDAKPIIAFKGNCRRPISKISFAGLSRGVGVALVLESIIAGAKDENGKPLLDKIPSKMFALHWVPGAVIDAPHTGGYAVNHRQHSNIEEFHGVYGSYTEAENGENPTLLQQVGTIFENTALKSGAMAQHIPEFSPSVSMDVQFTPTIDHTPTEQDNSLLPLMFLKSLGVEEEIVELAEDNLINLYVGDEHEYPYKFKDFPEKKVFDVKGPNSSEYNKHRDNYHTPYHEEARRRVDGKFNYGGKDGNERKNRKVLLEFFDYIKREIKRSGLQNKFLVDNALKFESQSKNIKDYYQGLTDFQKNISNKENQRGLKKGQTQNIQKLATEMQSFLDEVDFLGFAEGKNSQNDNDYIPRENALGFVKELKRVLTNAKDIRPSSWSRDTDYKNIINSIEKLSFTKDNKEIKTLTECYEELQTLFAQMQTWLDKQKLNKTPQIKFIVQCRNKIAEFLTNQNNEHSKTIVTKMIEQHKETGTQKNTEKNSISQYSQTSRAFYAPFHYAQKNIGENDDLNNDKEELGNKNPTPEFRNTKVFTQSLIKTWFRNESRLKYQVFGTRKDTKLLDKQISALLTTKEINYEKLFKLYEAAQDWLKTRTRDGLTSKRTATVTKLVNNIYNFLSDKKGNEDEKEIAYKDKMDDKKFEYQLATLSSRWKDKSRAAARLGSSTPATKTLTKAFETFDKYLSKDITDHLVILINEEPEELKIENLSDALIKKYSVNLLDSACVYVRLNYKNSNNKEVDSCYCIYKDQNNKWVSKEIENGPVNLDKDDSPQKLAKFDSLFQSNDNEKTISIQTKQELMRVVRTTGFHPELNKLSTALQTWQDAKGVNTTSKRLGLVTEVKKFVDNPNDETNHPIALMSPTPMR